MQIGKFTQEESVIHQYIKTKAERCLEFSNQQETVRFGLELYKSCRGIFLRQRCVEKVLLQYCLIELYIRDVKGLVEKEEEKGRSRYLQVLLNAKNNITLYLSQVFVRFLILGLCVKLGEKQRSQAKSKIKQLIKQLQIQLVVSGGKGLADTIIDELKVLKEEFGCVEFFEEVRSILQKCDTFHALEWIEKQLEERRQNFEKKMEESQKQQAEKPENTRKKVCIKRRVTVSNVDALFQIQEAPLKEGKEPSKSSQREVKESQKENREESKSKDQKKSLSLLARKARMSMGSVHSSQKKPQTRFIFKSSKKQTQVELDACYEEQASSPSKERSTASIQAQKLSTFSTKKPLISTQEKQDSKTLCQETPPRPSRSAVKRFQ